MEWGGVGWGLGVMGGRGGDLWMSASVNILGYSAGERDKSIGQVIV